MAALAKRIGLGVALAVGMWALLPGVPAQAQDAQSYFCAKAYPTGTFLTQAHVASTPAEVAALTAQGYTCVPQDVAETGPTFNCTFRGINITDTSLVYAVAIKRAGGSCGPSR